MSQRKRKLSSAHFVVEITNAVEHFVPEFHDGPVVVSFLAMPIAIGDPVVVPVVVNELSHCCGDLLGIVATDNRCRRLRFYFSLG